MRKNKINIYILILLFVFIAASFSILALSGCGPLKKNKSADQKAMYHCPMHPTYISDKPGDCPICGMKLVKTNIEEKAVPVVKTPEQALEKTLEEVCIEHNCAMNNCNMHVKTNIKPGERIICPICGEVISTANGKVVEIIQPPRQDSKTSMPKPKKSGERKILYYRNPMNPEATSPRPMKDSMGMDYVPVYEEEVESESAGPTITISPEKQQLIGIKTEPVTKRRLEKIVRASGKIAYDPELAITQEEFVQALKNLDNTKDSPLQDVIDRAKSLVEASRQRLRLFGMNDDQIAELEKTKNPETNLYLPKKGEDVWAYIWIYEYEIGLVKVGAEVEIDAVSYPGEKFIGTIVSINPVLDAATRTNQVRVKIPNPEDKLKPEMFVNAKIKTDLGEKLAVPEAAVLDTGLRKITYLSKENNVLEQREINIGQKAEGYYEVLSGLKEGDIVVTSGNFLVDSESRLQSAISSEQKHGE